MKINAFDQCMFMHFQGDLVKDDENLLKLAWNFDETWTERP